MTTKAQLLHALRTAPTAALRTLARQFRQLTPGERWTAALALLLSTSMLLFGAPVSVLVNPARPAPRTNVAPPPPQLPPVESSPGPALPPAPDTSIRPPPIVGPFPPVAPVNEIPSLVGLVRTGDSPVPGHDESSIAKVFVGRAGVTNTTMITLDPGVPDLCARVLTAGKLVLASEALPVTLRSCLIQGGATVIAFDADGNAPPMAEGGQVLSSRRGLEESLIDLGRWGKASETLAGKVGVIGVRSSAFATDAAVARMRSMGINVLRAVYLDGSSPTEVTDSVRDFASLGVDVVLFAAPVDTQRRWVAQASVLGRPFTYVVSDAHDAIRDETYPATFDGTLAHTSLRVPWYMRSHAETSVQSRCRTTWEAAAVPPRTLSTSELMSVFIWCQHADLVLTATRAAEQGMAFGTALRSLVIESPLTSDLGPTVGGGYGPTQDAVLVWRASCSCWMESRPFAAR